jgi:hypothetical protein
MSSMMKRFIKGIVLRGLTDETDIVSKDGSGAVFYNKTDARIKTYVENSIREILTNSQSQVLTNKTIDFNENTISNIPGLDTNFEIFNTTVTIGTSASTATGLLHYKTTKDITLNSVYAQLFEKNGVASGLLTVDVKRLSDPGTFIATGNTLLENFESGSFTTNNWTVVNGSEFHKFYVGGAVFNSGTKSAYISNDGGVSNKYSAVTSVVWFYKDIAIPVDGVNLNFMYRVAGEQVGTTYYDSGKVIIDPSLTTVPVAGTNITITPAGGSSTQLVPTANVWTNQSISVSNYAGTTIRVIFGWRNDNSLTNNDPIAIDDITISTVADASVLNSKPSFNFATAQDYATSVGTVLPLTISSGTYLRLDLTSIPSGFLGHIQIILTGEIVI